MEIEPNSPQLIAKKLWNIVRVVFYLLKKGITKSKIMLDLDMLFKRGKLAGNKALNNLIHHLHDDHPMISNSLTCRSGSTDIRMSIVHRREYEFSCSNSPAFPASYFSSKRKNYHHYKPKDINLVQKVFDILNNYEKVDASPRVVLPGFGQSPMVRQLRVTDSPFPVKDFEENPQVDKDAEEFITKFYKDLKQQRRIASLESPSPYNIWAR